MTGIAGVLLAGGENRRFPILKGFIKINGSTIVEKNLALLKDLFQEVFISTNMPEKYFYLGVPLIGDVMSSRGPMSGIHSSFLNADGETIFVIACDMPFASKEAVSFVCNRHSEAETLSPEGIDATIPVFNGKAQPLFGAYHKKILLRLENMISEGKTSMNRFLSDIKTNFIQEADFKAIDPDGRSLVNINTVEDYENIFHGL